MLVESVLGRPVKASRDSGRDLRYSPRASLARRRARSSTATVDLAKFREPFERYVTKTAQGWGARQQQERVLRDEADTPPRKANAADFDYQQFAVEYGESQRWGAWGLSREELFAAATDGLLAAARTYDEEHASQASFWTYARPFVHGTMVKLWRQRNTFSGDTREAQVPYEFRKAEERMAVRLARWPRAEEVAAEVADMLGLDAQRVLDVALSESAVARIDGEPIDEDVPGIRDKVPQYVYPVPQRVVLDRARRQAVRDALDTLPADLREVARFRFLRFAGRQSYAAVADEFGITVEQAMLKVSRALGMLAPGLGAWKPSGSTSCSVGHEVRRSRDHEHSCRTGLVMIRRTVAPSSPPAMVSRALTADDLARLEASRTRQQARAPEWHFRLDKWRGWGTEDAGRVGKRSIRMRRGHDGN